MICNYHHECRDLKDFTLEETIRFVELIEALGGSKALKAAADATVDVNTLNEGDQAAMAQAQTLLEGPGHDRPPACVKITRLLGNIYTITLDTPRGTGVVLFENGQQVTSYGVTYYKPGITSKIDDILIVAYHQGRKQALSCTFGSGKVAKAVFFGRFNDGVGFKAVGKFSFAK